MSAISNQPNNRNYLSPLGFKFELVRLPNLTFFTQGVNLPGVSFGRTDIPTPFVRLPTQGDHINYDDLTLTFKVDELMNNYVELYEWMVGLGFPENFDQYKNYTANNKVYSDGSLVVLSSNMNPIRRITFRDMFPTSLSAIQFDSTPSDVDYVTATVVFAFKDFVIERP